MRSLISLSLQSSSGNERLNAIVLKETLFYCIGPRALGKHALSVILSSKGGSPMPLR